MRYLKYGGVGLVGLVLAVLLVPYLINFNAYKNDISDQVQATIGRSLIIKGDLKLSLLPAPSLKAKEISLTSLPDTQDPYLIKVAEVKVNLALLPLLTGKIVIDSLELEEPHLSLETLPNGTNNWDLLPKRKEEPSNSSSTEGESKSSPFEIEKVKISKGHLRYKAGPDQTDIKDIDITLNLESFKGPIDFKSEFKVLEQDVFLEGTLQEVGDIIPIKAQLKALGEKITLTGTFKTKEPEFDGLIKLKGNFKNLKRLISDLTLPEGLQKDYKLEATLLFKKDKITLAPIDFKLGLITAKGEASYDLKKATSYLGISLNPGQITFEIHPQSTLENAFFGKLLFKSQNIKSLLEALKISSQDLPQSLSSDISCRASLSYKDKSLSMRDMDFNIGKANLKGSFILNKHSNGKNVYVYDLATKDLALLTSLGGVVLPNSIGAATFKGETTAVNNRFTTTTDLNVASSNLHIEGVIEDSQSLKPSIKINASGASLKGTLARLGLENPPVGLGKFSFSTTITGDLKGVIKSTLHKSQVYIGGNPVTLTGSKSLSLGGAKPKIVAALTASSLNLDDLLGTPKEAPRPTKFSKDPTPKAASISYQGQGHWSQDKIDFSFLRTFEGDITLTLATLRKGSLVFDGIEIKSRLANGIFEISSLTGNLYGGKLTAKGRISSQQNQPINFTAALTNAQLKNILPQQNEIKVLRGIFNLSTDLSTQGTSQYQYVNNLNGSLSFEASKGAISGFNLQKVIKDLKAVKDLQSALKLLDMSFSGGETTFNTVESQMVLKKGTAQITQFDLLAEGAKATASGKINLPLYSLDVLGTVKLEIDNFPSFSVRFFGPLDNPQRQLKTEALQQYLLKNVISKVVDTFSKGKGEPEKIIKGLLGIGGKDSTAPSQTQQPQEQQSDPQQSSKAEDPVGAIIEKGLKGLFQ